MELFVRVVGLIGCIGIAVIAVTYAVIASIEFMRTRQERIDNLLRADIRELRREIGELTKENNALKRD